MKPSEAVARHREEIRRIVLANRARNPRIFGSTARGEDHEGSDLDILVDSTPETSLFDLGRINYLLEHLLNIDVDVLSSDSLRDGVKNHIMRDVIPI